MSVHLRHCSQKSGVALTQLLPPRVLPPGSRGGAEGYSSAGVPEEVAAGALSRAVPQGELSPRSAGQGRCAGKGELRRFTGSSEAAPEVRSTPQGRISGAPASFLLPEISGAHLASANSPALVQAILLPILVRPSVCVE